MALKNIPDPRFPNDDGSADPRLTAALAAWAADPSTEPDVLAALHEARLLTPVVARPAGTEEQADEEPQEEPHGESDGHHKKNKMVVPMFEAEGRRALLAFTSAETMARWRSDARPVPVGLDQTLKAAVHEKADTLVVDLAGPVTYQVTGRALLALFEGRTTADPLADPAVAEVVRGVLAGVPGVSCAYLTPSAETDGTLVLALTPDADPGAAAQRVAEQLVAHQLLQARLARGLDLALLPPGTRVTGEPFYSR